MIYGTDMTTFNYKIHLPLLSYRDYNNGRTSSKERNIEIRELRQTLTDLIKGQFDLVGSLRFEDGIWYAILYLQDKEDVARMKLFKDCIVIDGYFFSP